MAENRPAEPLEIAFAEADSALAAGEVPVGAVVVAGDGTELARAGNRVEADGDPSGHAELLALRAAGRARGAARLPDAWLYVTLEPCAMCAQAIAFARLAGVTFAAYDPKGGGVDHGPRIFAQPTCHHRPSVVGGVQERRGRALVQRFFAQRR